MSRETLARININSFRHNLARVRQLAPHSRVVSVVKADAYGHGVAQALDGLQSSDVLAVATATELETLRVAGWRGRLLLLEGFAGREEYEAVLATDAEFAIHHESQLNLLEEQASADRTAAAPSGQQPWLKLDSGMHRLGFPAEQATSLFERLTALCGREPVLMSHFACADEPDRGMTQRQLARFDSATVSTGAKVSLANSAAILNFPRAHRDYVRPGIMLYGISPLAGKVGADHDLRPVMTLSCRLLAINEVRAGETVGYGARYRCPEDMRIGVAGIGYGDGYPRALPDGTPVLLNGRRARLAGRVSMDMITLDLRGHETAQPGDEVVLWGEGLPVEEIARHADMIPYELVCGVTARVRRVPT